jgi:hypothetical protein
MNFKIVTSMIFAAFFASNAEKIHVPSFFPVQDGARWIYKDEFGGFDTATMKVDTTFLQQTNIELFYSSHEQQFFRADMAGLKMVGQTIPLGTFLFDTPLGIAGIDAEVGDAAWTYNWEVTHVPSGIHRSWGSAQASLDGIATNVTFQDSTYDSVIVITVMLENGYGRYYLAKGRGIVRSMASNSPSFRVRELVGFIPGTAAANRKIWQTSTPRGEVRLISESSGGCTAIKFTTKRSVVQAKIFNSKGQLLVNRSFNNSGVMELRLHRSWGAGCYILQISDGTMYQNRSFSIVR